MAAAQNLQRGLFATLIKFKKQIAMHSFFHLFYYLYTL